MSTAVDFNKKSIVIVTGASRGIGSTIAIRMGRLLTQPSIFLLLARSEQGLINTKDKILEENPKHDVQYRITDFSKPDVKLYESLLEQFTSCTNVSNVSYAYCFNNAGHTGVLVKASSLTDLQSWRDYFEMNLYSAVLLTCTFMKILQAVAKQLVIVNISSLAYKLPFENFAMYGAGKASREIYFKVLALEEPGYLVLNYCPGPVDTEMFNNVINEAESEGLKETFKSIKEKSILTTDQSVGRLLNILEKGDYKSGDTIDYYDRE